MARETGRTGFKVKLIKELEGMFPGIMILPGDANNRQGIPDLIFLWRDRWAAFEVKASPFSSWQPNQEWYINKMDDMSFASFIWPENKDEVLRDLQQAWGA